MSALTRASVYFLLVFAAGFALGVVRVLWLVPGLGERWAELAEMPVMLLVIVVSARFVTKRFSVPRVRDWLLVGVIALLLLVTVELTVVLTLRGLSIGQYLAARDPIAGTAYVAMLVVFALMPALVASRTPS